MKVVQSFVLFTSLLSTSAFATIKYECTENKKAQSEKIVVTQIGHNPVEDGGPSNPFLLEIFEYGAMKAKFRTVVNVKIEDVMFKMTLAKQRISGIIFFDEPSDSHLTIGSREYRLTCVEALKNLEM